MRYLVEKTDPYSEYPHLTDERHECETASEAGVWMEELCPMDAQDVRDTLWRGEDFIRDVDEESGIEVTVSRVAEPREGLTAAFYARQGWRLLSGLQTLSRPKWLDDFPWAWPTWRVRCRPFDWAHDPSDVPLPDPDPGRLIPERWILRLTVRGWILDGE